MKLFVLLTCVSSAFAATTAATTAAAGTGATTAAAGETGISGDLAVASADGVLTVSGDLTGLPKSMAKAGIHVHTGTDCTNGGFKTAEEIKTLIGGHLMSNSVDGWAFPTATTYNSDGTGSADVVVTAKTYALATANATTGQPAVEGRCIVMHGLTASDLSPRVAIGKIAKDGNGYSAAFAKYPGPNTLSTVPAGKLTVTVKDGEIQLKGTITGLAPNIVKGGIHVHTGTDCTGGDKLTDKDEVNKVVGGHLLSKGDGYLLTKYDSGADGKGTINFSTPKGSYTLRTSDANADLPAVESHCIVIHNGDGARVGIGQILCDTNGCKAAMGAYPVPVSSGTTVAATTVAKTDDKSGATDVFLALSALAVACIGSVF